MVLIIESTQKKLITLNSCGPDSFTTDSCYTTHSCVPWLIYNYKLRSGFCWVVVEAGSVLLGSVLMITSSGVMVTVIEGRAVPQYSLQ